MYKARKLIAIILCMAIITAACEDSKSKQLARAEDDFAQGLKSAATIIADAKQSNFLTQEDVDNLKPTLKVIGESHLQLVQVTRDLLQFGQNIPIDKQEKLLAMINFMADQLTQLNNEGILRIKNQDKRMLFNTVVLSMQSALVIVISILKIGVKK